MALPYDPEVELAQGCAPDEALKAIETEMRRQMDHAVKRWHIQEDQAWPYVAKAMQLRDKLLHLRAKLLLAGAAGRG